jgi:hypothetical protein
MPGTLRRSSHGGRHTTSRGHRRDVAYLSHSKVDLYERARSLRIEGRSRMSKRELARAIARAERVGRGGSAANG